MRVLMLGLMGCGVKDSDTGVYLEPSSPTCGQNAPVVNQFRVLNGSADPQAAGPSLLLELEASDVDGDLGPSVRIDLFWDTLIDGEVEAGTHGVSWPQYQGRGCATPTLSTSLLVSVDDLSSDTEAFPFDSVVEFVLQLTDHDGLISFNDAGHTAVSEVLRVCTPQANGEDSTLLDCDF